MKRPIVYLMVITLLLGSLSLVFTGCSGSSGKDSGRNNDNQSDKQSSETEKAGGGADNGKVTQVTVFHRWPPESDSSKRQEIFELADKKYDDVSLVIDTVPASMYEAQITVRLASSNPPDIFCTWPGGRTEALVRNNSVMDLTDFWTEQGWNESFTRGVVEGCTHFDGKKYVVPMNVMGNNLWYNKKVFEENGCTVPETWDELMDIADKLKTAGVTPFALGVQPTRWASVFWLDYLMLNTCGSKFREDLMWGKESWTSPEVENVFIIWKDMVEKGYFNDDFAAMDWRESLNKMINGECAMILMGDWIIGTLMEEEVGWKPGEDFDFFTFPRMDSDIPPACEGCIEAWVINSETKVPEAAKSILSYWGSKEGMTGFAQRSNVIVPFKDIDWNVYSEDSREMLKRVGQAISKNAMHQNFELATLPAIQDTGMDGFIEFMTHPEKYKQILQRIEQTSKDTFMK